MGFDGQWAYHHLQTHVADEQRRARGGPDGLMPRTTPRALRWLDERIDRPRCGDVDRCWVEHLGTDPQAFLNSAH